MNVISLSGTKMRVRAYQFQDKECICRWSLSLSYYNN